MSIVRNIYHNKAFSKIFHTLVYELQRELSDCKTVLDLGCGPDSPLQFCKNIENSLGVEAFEEYLNKSRNKAIHNSYLCKRIEELEFEDNSFDAVILIEVIEHLPTDVGAELLKKAERWAKKKIVVTTPNGFIEQKALDGNILQKHLAGWTSSQMESLNYRVKGLAGLKILRQEVQGESMGGNIMTSIRFWPKPLWFIIASLSQIVVYFFPKLAFELFCVKCKEK